MDGNEFRRRLQAISDPNQRFMMAQVYEMVMDIARQVDTMAKAQLAMANTMGNFVNIHEALGGQIKALERVISGNRDGEQFKSVPIDSREME